MNVREGEEKMAVHLSSATVKGHQMGVSSQVRVSKPDKSTYLDTEQKAVELLLSGCKGCYDFTSAFEGIWRNCW